VVTLRSVRLTTANLLDFNKPPVNEQRQHAQVAFLRDEEPDVLCIQEFWHATHDPDNPRLAAAFAAFRDELGMDGRLAWASSWCHVAVLWNPNTAELRSWEEFSRWPFHHTLGVAELDVGAGRPWRIATTQLSPAGPEARFTEANLVAMAGLGDPETITFLGADFNAPSAEPALPDQGRPFYDPEPYHGQPPGLPQQLYQVTWDDNPDAPPVVDRRAMERLRRGGLVDVAWYLRIPWTPTTGHHADPHGYRRIDGWRASAAALDLVTAHQVAATDHSDHREVTITARTVEAR
jgi:hypothetical protein